MSKIKYFKPTKLFKEYRILDLIEKDPHVTQRTIAKDISSAVSLVNLYLESYEKLGYLKRSYQNSKNVDYIITKKGIERKKVLNIGYLSETQNLYNKAKEDINNFLNQIINKGYRDIILYGAGEVAEIILQTIFSDRDIPLKVVSLIDDDVNRQKSKLVNIEINGIDCIDRVKHDCIVISAYTYYEKILTKLLKKGYLMEKIEYFFKWRY